MERNKKLDEIEIKLSYEKNLYFDARLRGKWSRRFSPVDGHRPCECGVGWMKPKETNHLMIYTIVSCKISITSKFRRISFLTLQQCKRAFTGIVHGNSKQGMKRMWKKWALFLDSPCCINCYEKSNHWIPHVYIGKSLYFPVISTIHSSQMDICLYLSVWLLNRWIGCLFKIPGADEPKNKIKWAREEKRAYKCNSTFTIMNKEWRSDRPISTDKYNKQCSTTEVTKFSEFSLYSAHL